MPKRRVKRKRSKGLALILLPALIFIGVIGWLIYTLELPSRKAPKVLSKKFRAETGDDSVTLFPAIYEDNKEIINQ
jgi:hypothetical protein